MHKSGDFPACGVPPTHSLTTWLGYLKPLACRGAMFCPGCLGQYSCKLKLGMRDIDYPRMRAGLSRCEDQLLGTDDALHDISVFIFLPRTRARKTATNTPPYCLKLKHGRAEHSRPGSHHRSVGECILPYLSADQVCTRYNDSRR